MTLLLSRSGGDRDVEFLGQARARSRQLVAVQFDAARITGRFARLMHAIASRRHSSRLSGSATGGAGLWAARRADRHVHEVVRTSM